MRISITHLEGTFKPHEESPEYQDYKWMKDHNIQMTLSEFNPGEFLLRSELLGESVHALGPDLLTVLSISRGIIQREFYDPTEKQNENS